MELHTSIDSELHEAASEGIFDKFQDYPHLDQLLTRTKNTILHIYLTSSKTRSSDFIGKIHGKCPSLLQQTNDNGDTPLHIAARYGHFDAAKALINFVEADEDIESRGEKKSVRLMLRMANKNKDTALHEAARSLSSRSDDIVKEILDNEDAHYMYSPNAQAKPPLYLAVSGRFPDTKATKILNSCKSIDYRGPNGKTALHAAVLHRNTDVIVELIEKRGSLVREADENGWTPLHYAAYKGYKNEVEILLDKDTSAAYIDDKDMNMTALHIAAFRGHKDITDMIIDKCVNCCELVDKQGRNVLHYAVISKRDGVLKVILKRPYLLYLLEGKDEKGYTPLQLLYVSRDGMIPVDLLPLKSWSEHPFMLYWASCDDLTSEKKNDCSGWMEDLGNGPFGKNRIEKNSKNTSPEKEMPELQKASESHLVVAALVATVTFAAAFTLPGGYISDGNDAGTPILIRNSAFKAFVVWDAIAMVLSTSSVFIHFMMVLAGYKYRYLWLIKCAFWFIVGAMVAMVIAFVTGTYSVLAHSSGLAVGTCIIAFSFVIFALFIVLKLGTDNFFVYLPDSSTRLDVLWADYNTPLRLWRLVRIMPLRLLVIFGMRVFNLGSPTMISVWTKRFIKGKK